MFCCGNKVEIPFCSLEAINTHTFLFLSQKEITNTSLFSHLWFSHTYSMWHNDLDTALIETKSLRVLSRMSEQYPEA